ncbi:MAG: anthranilate synthase component I [Chloroherpetonaceae bacterium]|nr:anthranilate synthase component I [Chloroherpetonaceae bacterium]
MKSKDAFIFKPLIEELMADTETPVSVYLKLKSKYSCLLESVEGEERIARFSYIGINPFMKFEATISGAISVKIFDERFDKIAEEIRGIQDVREALKVALDLVRNEMQISSKMLTSGAFGFFTYDAAHLTERFKIPENPHPVELPDIALFFYDTLVVFDNVRRKLFIISNYLKGTGNDEREKRNAERKISEVKKLIYAPLSTKEIQLKSEKSELLTSNVTKKQYLDKVNIAKEYILAGDIFQVQLSQRLSRTLNARPFDVYRSLRTINPSPYLYFFEMGKVQIIGSSPELLVSVERDESGERIVQTRPIAGTRKRGKTLEEDKALAEELLHDEKELAEHLMLIDLSRNDVGKISKTGSVDTNEIMIIERYSHVMHIVSNVKGILKEELHPLDAFWSCFPAGTLTGAPKIRSMEIISELEDECRGLYGGAVGYFDFNGNLKTAIAIRTMLTKTGKIYFQAAGGIVADSVPINEFEETLSKMKAGIRSVENLIPENQKHEK